MKTSTRSRRAMSPSLATIILIAITFVGALVVYSIFIIGASTAGSQSQVQVVSDQLDVPTGGGQAIWTITIKNSGNKPIATLTVQLGVGGGSSTELIGCTTSPTVFFLTTNCSGGTVVNLAPGQYISGSSTVTGTVTIGQIYTVTVIATFVDGSTSTNVFSVQATIF